MWQKTRRPLSLSLSGPLGIGQQNWHGRIASSQLLRCTKSSSSQLGRFPANEVGICAKKSFQFSKSYLTTLRVIIQYVRAMLLFQGRVKFLQFLARWRLKHFSI